MKHGLLRHLAIVVVIAVACGAVTAEGGPLDRRIPYTGRLEAASGPVTVLIELFRQPVGGSAVWGPELQEVTPDAGGRFALQIGASGLDRCHPQAGALVCDAGDGVADLDQLSVDEPLYVAVRLPGGAGWTELAPRQPLFPAFHALGVTSAGSGLPVGAVIPFWGSVTEIPADFELCDGALPTTVGATLVGAKPDLRGRFDRGADAAVTDVTTPSAGGADSSSISLGGHALTRAELPNDTVNLSSFSNGSSGGHSHVMIRQATGQQQRCTGDDGGPTDIHYALGNSPAHTCPGQSLNLVGHTHNLVGTLSSGGSGQAHTHTYSVVENRPAFLQVLFIIRVR